jgi:hypothetical protein
MGVEGEQMSQAAKSMRRSSARCSSMRRSAIRRAVVVLALVVPSVLSFGQSNAISGGSPLADRNAGVASIHIRMFTAACNCKVVVMLRPL